MIKNYTCGTIIPSGCVPYTGSDLTCLINPATLPCDASMNDVVFQLDAAIKTLQNSNNFTTLNPLCLTFDPATVTAVQLHQLEITNICGLQASLTALQTIVDNLNIGNELIDINLQCLTPSAAPCLVPPSSYSLLSILNVIISEVCALKTAVGI